jgi:hypothetical protein
MAPGGVEWLASARPLSEGGRTVGRRDRCEEDVESVADEPAVPEAPPSPQIARVLALQRSAGNRQVADVLRRSRSVPWLQRVNVEGKAEWTSGQRHHPHYEFTFPGDNRQTFDFDQWFSGKKGPAGAYAATITPDTVQAIVAQYDGTGSIIDRIVAQLVGTGAMAKPDLAKLSDKGYTQKATFDVQPGVANAPGGAEFAAHFLALKHNVALREADMRHNVVLSLTVTTKPKTPAAKDAPKADLKGTPYALEWDAVLAGARRLLAPELQKGTAPPIKEKVTFATDALMKAGGNIGKLRGMGIIDEGLSKKGQSAKGTAQQADHQVVEQTPEKTPDGKPMLFNFGINHLRTILYVEWRATYELQQLAKAPPAQQNVPQAAQLVQQLVGVGNQ